MRIVAYCRVSTDKEEQLESLEHQKVFFEEFSKIHGHKLIKIYADEGISGKQIKNRQQFLKMIEDSKYGLFDMVVVKDISRFSRNTVDFLNAIRQLKQNNIEVQFLSNNQTILGNSEFILTIFSALAQEESANLSKRVKFGKKINAKKGRVPNIIYGYNSVDTFTLEENKEESSVVKRIFDMFANQKISCRKISDTLNEEGIPTKWNKLWDERTIRRLLKNPVYSGTLVNNKSEIADFIQGTRVSFDESNYLYHDRPQFAIISKELFNKAQEEMERRKLTHAYEYAPKYKVYKESSVNLFSSLLRCEDCGYSYSKRRYNSSKYKPVGKAYWKCVQRNVNKKLCSNAFTIDEDFLINHITNYFKNIIKDKNKFIQKTMSKFQTKENETLSKNLDTETIQKDINRFQKMKEKYQIMFTNDIITIEELKVKIRDFDTQINKLNDLLINSEYTKQKAEDYLSKVQSILQNIENFLNLQEVTNADLKTVIDYITCNKDGEIKIYLKL